VTKSLVAIALIFCGASLAWMILGGTLASRTADSDTAQQAQLGTQWGGAQTQKAPTVFSREGPKFADRYVPLESSRINVVLDLAQRRKGLLWYNLYDVMFAAQYAVRNTTNKQHLYVQLPVPDAGGSYADLVYKVGDRRIDNTQAINGVVDLVLKPNESTTIGVAYRSRGIESWTYQFNDGVASVRNVDLTMATNFKAIDFPPKTLLPTSEVPLGTGWALQWKYATLVTGNGIGMTIPYPLQPGPLAQRITFWAPVSLLFYIFVMLLITTLRRINLHPMNYFFLACAFFAFHLLLAYLVDRMRLEYAFIICSIVSMFLTISYLRLVVGLRFAAFEAGLAQLVYLVLFSYALFNEGWSGLTITIGAIITLFVAMQLTGRIRWSERFAVAQLPVV
jgi:Inner membrane protein CreD